MILFFLITKMKIKFMAEIICKDNSSNPLAVIHNDLVRASYDMTTSELRLFLIVLSQLPKSEDDPFTPDQPCYVTKEDFVKLGVEPKNVVREIRTACKLMRKREFRIDTSIGELSYPFFDSVLNIKDDVYAKLKEKHPDARNDDEFINELKFHNVLDIIDVVLNSDANIVVRIVIHRKIIPYLVKLRANFTKLYLKEFFTFSGSYSFRLYFILMQFRTDTKNNWWCKISIKDLRKSLMLEGKYEANKDLKKYVIDAAVNEINKKSPYHVTYEMTKTGRKFTHLELKFKEKNVAKKVEARDPNTIDWVSGYTDNEAKKPYSWQLKGLSDGQIRKIGCNVRDFVDANSSKMSNNDSRGYPAVFEDWKTLLKDPKTVNTFKMVQELLDRKM